VLSDRAADDGRSAGARAAAVSGGHVMDGSEPVNRYASNELRECILERDHYRCKYCGWVSLASIGEPTSTTLCPGPKAPRPRENLVTACWSCYRAKGRETCKPRPIPEVCPCAVAGCI
jgi:hypothetical protein